MGAKTPKIAANIRKIQTVLMDDWDPITIKGVPEAADDFYTYVMPIYQMLRQHRPEAALLDYLTLMLQHMGLSAPQDSLRSVVAKLFQLDISGDEPLD